MKSGASACNANHAREFFAQAAALHQAGRMDEAMAGYRKVIAINPAFAEAHGNLGVALLARGQLDEAIESLRRATALKPDLADLHHNLGLALQGKGDLQGATGSYRRAVSLNPRRIETHCCLGDVLRMQGKPGEAIESYRKALRLNPNIAGIHYNLGGAWLNLGNMAEAISSFRRALALAPGFAEAHSSLGDALAMRGHPDEAAASYRQALSLKPDCAPAHHGLGNLFQDKGEAEAAIASYRKAISLDPAYADAHANLGLALRAQERLDEALASYRQALSIKPGMARFHYNLAAVLHEKGELEAAIESYRRALALDPLLESAYSNLLFLYAYRALLSPQEYLALARNWEQTCVPAQEREAARRRIFRRSPLAGRRLRVGYVSGDFRQHVMSYFVEQLLAHHDRARVEIFAYSTNNQRDAVTERLQALVDHWVPVANAPTAALLERIEADGIDVLVDLSGHTGHCRMDVFARRAAPVQAHYLGYFASTGLTEMDYFFGDQVLTPPGTDSHFSERIWRLPRIRASYDGKEDAPAPGWRPDRDAAVWVGSFSNFGKLTPETLALFAGVLHALPEGKLLLKVKRLDEPAGRQRILDALSGHGIPAHRIEIHSSNITPGWQAHMAYYDRLDIALDPVGAHGGYTTTCDALWMGVPVIALEGDRMASRMTASLLDAVGHPEWIARSEAEYVDKVVSLARNVALRKTLRFVQRGKMADSPLCDAGDLAANMENAYFEMFERWESTGK